MGRQPKKCPKKCTKHLFSLKPVHYSAFFSRETQFSYCGPNLKDQANIPKFNRDRKAYTAAFILASDQFKLESNDQIYRIEHERIKKQNYQQKSQIFIPKPRSKSYYCSLCKQIYDDYLEHTSSLKHKQQIKNSPFNSQILQLCRMFGNNIKKVSNIIFANQLFNVLDCHLKFQDKQLPEELKHNHQHENQYEQPEFFIQKSTKQTLDGLTLCKSIKSFHTYAQLFEPKQEKCVQDNFFHRSLIKQINQNCKVSQYGTFKAIQQTASPVKTKFQKPIILAGNCFTLDN